MPKRETFLNHPKIKAYFKDKLEMDESEFDRRLQLYLEIFPFLAMDFRMRNDCHAIHQTAQLNTSPPRGPEGSHHHLIRIQDTQEVDQAFGIKANEYRELLEEIRTELELIIMEI